MYLKKKKFLEGKKREGVLLRNTGENKKVLQKVNIA